MILRDTHYLLVGHTQSHILENRMNDCYVYQLISPITKEPFYIGKGTGDRAWQHLKGADSNNLLKRAVVETIRHVGKEPTVSILHEDLETKDALRLETSYIRKHGRLLYEPKGILTNIVLSGYVERIKDKNKIRKVLKKLCYSKEHYELLSGLLTDRSNGGSRSSTYRTVQLSKDIVDRLEAVCNENGWYISTPIHRLIDRFLAGEFSGSLSDVLAPNAGPEYGLTRKYMSDRGWISVPVEEIA